MFTSLVFRLIPEQGKLLAFSIGTWGSLWNEALRLRRRASVSRRSSRWAQAPFPVPGEIRALKPQVIASSREKLEADVSASREALAKAQGPRPKPLLLFRTLFAMVLSQAEADERSARSKLDDVTAKRTELECQAAAAQSDAETKRNLALSERFFLVQPVHTIISSQ